MFMRISRGFNPAWFVHYPDSGITTPNARVADRRILPYRLMARVPLLFVALVAALATGAAAVVFSPRTNTSACPDHAFKVRVYDADYCGAR